MEIQIKDNEAYLSRMRRTYYDKAWFMTIIPPDIETIVDFGCADGGFIQFLKSAYPEYNYIGIDNNPYFIEICERNNIVCYKSLLELVSIPINHEKTLLVLNSVMHEIYSYKCQLTFWRDIKVFSPKYIAFRDMYVRNCGEYGSRIEQDFENAIKGNFMEEHYNDFVNVWGKLVDGYTATHFLLKYFYNENWQRELEENYIPFHYRELHTKIRNAGYNITFERFFGLPYLKEKWHNDFNCNNHPQLKLFIDRLTTHLKLFLVRGFDY